MVYFASAGQLPAFTAGGPQTYQSAPFYKTSCGCGAGNQSLTMAPRMPAREGFNAEPQGMPVQLPQQGAPMCTLTATAPPAGCCNPAPLHCDCCNGSGFFRASEAYGS